MFNKIRQWATTQIHRITILVPTYKAIRTELDHEIRATLAIAVSQGVKAGSVSQISVWAENMLDHMVAERAAELGPTYTAAINRLIAWLIPWIVRAVLKDLHLATN